MRIGPRGAQHLTYCTNIHPGETWSETRSNLGRYLPAVKAQLSPHAPFGVGLRLSAAAARELGDPRTLADATALLEAACLYVFTINGFPYGDFHGRPVKESVYLPDWRSRERLRYTNLLADLLARLLPEGVAGSISTVPGAFRRQLVGGRDVELMTGNLLRHVEHLVHLERERGCCVALALEPEPCCHLSTIEECVRFYEEWLLAPAGLEDLARRTDLGSAAVAEEAVRRHLGICLDLCHAAVEFEHPLGAIAMLRGAGIPIPKVQLSAGLRLPRVCRDSVARLREFADPVFLHQVVERNGEGLRRYEDLDEAVASFDEAAGDREWRVHLRVPLFREDLGAFATTRDFVEKLLREHRRTPVTSHFEVETYSFGVLPEQYRDADIVTSIVRELHWARSQLQS